MWISRIDPDVVPLAGAIDESPAEAQALDRPTIFPQRFNALSKGRSEIRAWREPPTVDDVAKFVEPRQPTRFANRLQGVVCRSLLRHTETVATRETHSPTSVGIATDLYDFLRNHARYPIRREESDDRRFTNGRPRATARALITLAREGLLTKYLALRARRARDRNTCSRAAREPKANPSESPSPPRRR